MTLTLKELSFDRPEELQATMPAELRGSGRDDVRLLVSTSLGHTHTHFSTLHHHLEPGDLLVVNRSATQPASLPASGNLGAFLVNLSTKYAHNLWLAEPRWSHSSPGPLPIRAGENAQIAGLEAHFVAPHPGLPRLWFVHFRGDLERAMERLGRPIRYGYVPETYPLESYQTIFADTPGSAEMPSAARPFSQRIVEALTDKGVAIADITLHTGVSSLEVEEEDLSTVELYAEPFEVPIATAQLINRTKRRGGRVIAVGTTVVRALESVWDGERIWPKQGFTRRFIHPEACACTIDGILTGLHDPKATHLAMLYAIAGQRLVQEGYKEAVSHGYLWHEFGDSHLIFSG
jgi:S-adenosylmethionine:tRNA ribosyltransferase-isomerase